MILPVRMIGCFTAAAICVAIAASLIGAPGAYAAEEKRRIGPPPKVYKTLPNVCARCHKPDGRGGPSYGGFAADLRATALDKDGLIRTITKGVRLRGMPEFKSVLSKREIEGLATYIDERIKGVYLDADGNRITAEEAAALDPRKNDGPAKE